MVTGKKILIIEDNSIVANDMQRTLLDEGYGVVGIGNTYEQGLHLFLKNDPDLLICDIRLKSDRSGIDLINKIRSLKKLPVIYVTAYTDDITLSEVFKTNPESYIAKPFTDEQLLVSVYRVLKYSCKDEKCNGIHGAPTNRELEIISNIAKGSSSRAS